MPGGIRHGWNRRRRSLASHKVLVPLHPNQIKGQVSFVAQRGGKKKPQLYIYWISSKIGAIPGAGGCAGRVVLGCGAGAGLSAGSRGCTVPFPLPSPAGTPLALLSSLPHAEPIPTSSPPATKPKVFQGCLSPPAACAPSYTWAQTPAVNGSRRIGVCSAPPRCFLGVSTSWVEGGIAPPFRGSHSVGTSPWLSRCPPNPEAGGSGYGDRQLGGSPCYSQFGQQETRVIEPVLNRNRALRLFLKSHQVIHTLSRGPQQQEPCEFPPDFSGSLHSLGREARGRGRCRTAALPSRARDSGVLCSQIPLSCSVPAYCFDLQRVPRSGAAEG